MFETAKRKPVAPGRESLVRRYYQLVDDNDVEGLVALFDAGAVYHRPGYEPIRGHKQLKHFYTEQRVIREGRHTLDSVIVAGDEVAVRGSFHGTLHSGQEVDAGFADFFRVGAGGTIERRDTFFFAPLV